MHADATTPAEPLDAVAISSNGDGLPLKRERSASASVLFEACSAFTRVPACMVAKSPEVTRYTRVLQRICHLLHRPGCFRPGDRLAGWDSHPLEIADFHGIPVFRDFSAHRYGCLKTRCRTVLLSHTPPSPCRLPSGPRRRSGTSSSGDSFSGARAKWKIVTGQRCGMSVARTELRCKTMQYLRKP